MRFSKIYFTKEEKGVKRSLLLVSCLALILVASSVVSAEEGPIVTFTGIETGPLPEKFNEAPMLAEMVKAGVLPPVEERVPEEPLVIKPVEGIGQYGGTLHESALGPRQYWDLTHGTCEMYMCQVDNTASMVYPDIAKGYELSEDKKTLTIYLRKGMKWSDGQPFTADDIMFWWEDEANNAELSPAGPSSWWKIGGEFPKFEKVDDWTLRIYFAAPFPPIAGLMTNWNTIQTLFYDPKHYLKKWHIKYNPDADKLAKEEGYDHWWQAYAYHKGVAAGQQDPNLPVVGPWRLKEVTLTARVYERNPYFYAVDTAGNQLPYIDQQIVHTVANEEAVNMKTIAGEMSFSGQMLKMENYTLYKENEEKGDYRVLMWNSPVASEIQYAFNLNHKDPVLREIFQDIRFRQAMSLAINRDEINEIAYMGLATPCQSIVTPDCSFYKKEWGEYYAQYDPDKANGLLDEMGLKWDAEHKYRLRPDGQPLSVIIEMVEGAGLRGMIRNCELVKEYWENVGVRTDLKTMERSLHGTRINAGELDVGMWCSDRMEEMRCYIPGATKFNPRSEMSYAVQWGMWFDTEGEQGEEPPAEWKAQYKTMDKWYTAATDEEYQRLAEEVWDFFSEQLVIIGTVGYAPVPVVVRNDLKNVPEVANFGDGPNWSKTILPMQWYFEQK